MLAEFIIIGDKWIFNRLPINAYRLPITQFIDLNNV